MKINLKDFIFKNDNEIYKIEDVFVNINYLLLSGKIYYEFESFDKNDFDNLNKKLSNQLNKMNKEISSYSDSKDGYLYCKCGYSEDNDYLKNSGLENDKTSPLFNN